MIIIFVEVGRSIGFGYVDVFYVVWGKTRDDEILMLKKKCDNFVNFG